MQKYRNLIAAQNQSAFPLTNATMAQPPPQQAPPLSVSPAPLSARSSPFASGCVISRFPSPCQRSLALLVAPLTQPLVTVLLPLSTSCTQALARIHSSQVRTRAHISHAKCTPGAYTTRTLTQTGTFLSLSKRRQVLCRVPLQPSSRRLLCPLADHPRRSGAKLRATARRQRSSPRSRTGGPRHSSLPPTQARCTIASVRLSHQISRRQWRCHRHSLQPQQLPSSMWRTASRLISLGVRRRFRFSKLRRVLPLAGLCRSR